MKPHADKARKLFAGQKLFCPAFVLLTGMGTLLLSPAQSFALDSVALPDGGSVAGGAASFDYNAPGSLHVNQSTERAVINWNSFNIGRDASVEFHQPGSSSLTVNRVTGAGSDPTLILGSLKSNGRIMVLDRNGVIFGVDFRVDVGGIIATSGDVNDAQVMSGADKIAIENIAGSGAIINHGTITAREAGLVSFVAPTAVNNGIIRARLGRLQIGAGSKATIDLYGDGLMELELDHGAQQTLANTGLIEADGGLIQIEAAAAKDIVDNLVLNTGVIAANAVTQDQSGKIILSAATSHKGTATGGSIAVNTGILDASGYGPQQRGGAIEVLGDTVILANRSIVDASGDAGGGDIKIGGDYLGQGTTPTAQYTYVDQDALILNNAIKNGNGGRTIIWSDDTTHFLGSIYGRGGSISGNGGFTETSGKENLLAQGYVDLTAPHGNKGTYLLDPANITIYGNFDPTDIAGLELWLDGSDQSTLFSDTAGATPITNGGSVTRWNDKSGHHNDALMSIAGSRPTWNDNALNSEGVLFFDGSNDYMELSAGINNIRSAFFLINSLGSPAYAPVLAHTSTYDFHGSAVGYVFDTSYGNSHIAAGSAYVDGSSVSPSTIAQTSTYQNIELITTGNVSANLITNDRVVHGRVWHGNYAEVILYSQPLNTANRNLVEQYQAMKWGTELLSANPVTAASMAMDATTGYGTFTTRYLEHLSNTADIVLQAGNTITLDLQGDTLALANNRNISLITTNGNITDVSAGTIRTNRTSGGGNISITAGGAGHINLDTTNLEALGGGKVNLNAGGNISLTQTSALNLGYVSASNISIQADGNISGDGRIITTGGDISLSSDANLSLSSLAFSTSGGDIDLSGYDVTLSTAVNAGAGVITINSVRDIFVNQVSVASGLAGYWNFDEGNGTSAGDSSGNSNTGSLINGTSWSSNSPSGSGYSLVFDGTNDYVSFADSASLDVTGAFTLSLWMQSNGGQSNRYLLSKLNNAGNDNVYSVIYGYAANQAQFYASGNGFGYPAATSNINAGDGSWHLVTYTYDGSRYSTYKDGALISTENLGTNITASTGALLLGTFNGSGHYFNGSIDDVRVYNTALSAGQVAQLYSPNWQAGTTTFNAGRDITLNDAVTASGSGNSLVLASGRNFINNAGSGALDAGAGRWLIYSTRPADNDLDGLSPDFKRYNRTYGGYGPASVTEGGNGLLYSFAPVINITAQNKTRQYGSANPVFTTSVTGLIDGDTFASATGGTPDFVTAALNANVGSAPITVSAGSLTSDLGYQFTFSSGTLTITKAPLIVTANDMTRTSSQGNPDFTATITGFQFSDTIGNIDTQPIFSTAAGPASAPGSYDITPSGAIDNNYSFSYVNGILTITNAAIELPASFVNAISAAPVINTAPLFTQSESSSIEQLPDPPSQTENQSGGPSTTSYKHKNDALDDLIDDGLLIITPEAKRVFNI